jgi:xylulokinase
MSVLLGIDIGTQGTKAALYALDGGCLAEAFKHSCLYRPGPGVVEEDPETQVQSVLDTIRTCMENSHVDPIEVAGIAIAGQMAGIIGVDANGRAVTPYDSWLDTRCGPYIKRMQRIAGDEITEKTGNAPSFNHGPKKLWWKHERPADYARIRAFVQPGAYAAMRLCGLDSSKAFIDNTYLHFSGFADNRRSSWDEQLCHKFEMDPAKLPRIVDPQELVGEVRAPMAEKCGLRADTPVIAGCGDTAASFLSCGATSEGICVDVAGTASVFAATTRNFLADTRHHMLGCSHSAVPGLWHPYAYINGGGQNLEWFRRELQSNHFTFEELNRLALGVEDDASLPYFVPHFGGCVSPPLLSIRGAWLGLTWDTTPGHLFRAMLDGVALEYSLYKRALLDLLPNFAIKEIRVTGGGEKSSTWNQIKADRLQIPVFSVAGTGGTPMGSALMAGLGVGLFKDLPSVALDWVHLGEAYQPDHSKSKLAKERIQKYAHLLQMIDAWSREDSTPIL